jgi:GDP-L-fucose synthase
MFKQKLLILGAQGFLGANLVDFFSKNTNYDIYCTSSLSKKKPFSQKVNIYYKADLTFKSTVENLFATIKPDVVILAAANTSSSKDVIENPLNHVTDNCLINPLVIDACSRHKVKHMVFFSCSTMYENSDKPQKESDWNMGTPIYPPYWPVALMKIWTENLCKMYASLGNTKYTAIRLSNVFGPKDKLDLNRAHLVPSQIIKILKAKDKLEVWGDKDPKNQAWRDIIYVDDVVDMVDLVLKKQQTSFELYNCGQGEAFPVSEIVGKIQKAAGKEDLKITYNNSKPNIPTTVILDCKKAKKELGWVPKTSIEDGLSKTIEWYKENI